MCWYAGGDTGWGTGASGHPSWGLTLGDFCQREQRNSCFLLNCLWLYFCQPPNICGKSVGNVHFPEAEFCVRSPDVQAEQCVKRVSVLPEQRVTSAALFPQSAEAAQDGARGAGRRRGRARAPGAAGAQPAQRGRGTRAAGAVAAAQPLPAAPHRAQEWWVREGGREEWVPGPRGRGEGPGCDRSCRAQLRCCGCREVGPGSFTRQGSSWSSSRRSGT